MRIEHQQQPEADAVPTGTPAIESAAERRMREYIHLKRILRSPDIDDNGPDSETAPAIPIPEPIKLTGWVAVAAGGLCLCTALAGLVNYYGKDWQTILSVPLMEPESKVRIFFRIGFLPWLQLLFSVCFILAATQFLARRPRMPKILSGLAWGGIALILIQQATILGSRILRTSGSPPLLFYCDCAITFFVSLFLWSIPFLAVILLLRRKIPSSATRRAE